MGSIERRGKNSFRLSVVIGYEEDGTPIRERKTVQAKNKTEAGKELTLFESELLSGKYQKPTLITLRKFYDDWLELYAQDAYAPDTLNGYVNNLNKRILPKYGNMKLSEIEQIHVANFVNDLKKDGRRLDGKEGKLSPSTINNAYRAFNSIMARAKEWGYIKENPASGIKLPNVKSVKAKINYSVDNLWKMIECIKDEPFEKQVLFWVAFITSAREGEIAALEERHILKDKSAIYFEQSLYEKKGGGVGIKSIKNKLEGAAAIPTELMELIDKLLHQKRKEKLKSRDLYEYEDTIFLFSNEFGRPIRPDSISQWWIRFINKNKLPKIRFHDLRHLSITFLIGKNVPMKSISERARHSRIGTTMDIYGHNIIEVDQVAADHFKVFFQGKNA
ncbi:tyrosine-type recombinase/integrase [Evansella tamaricis]|uniref:Site-specific integrase n=1 Tax=Evansella tamaricis TaxID=2069301 RepID=A0ABS6JBR5_9BACI|nr:site-specific integrase [Evansella tamaricis]MBU9711121.1 site-specific integrase [Evansella tamaricis]